MNGLEDMPSNILRDELGRRGDFAELWGAAELANDLRLVFYARDASRFEMLLRVLERAGADA